MKICKHTHSKRTRLEFSSWEIYNMRMKMKTICGVDEMKLLLQSSALSLPPPQKTSHNLTSSSYYHSILFNLPPTPANISWLFHSVFFASREWVQLSFSFLSGGKLFFLRLRLYCLSFLSPVHHRDESEGMKATELELSTSIQLCLRLITCRLIVVSVFLFSLFSHFFTSFSSRKWSRNKADNFALLSQLQPPLPPSPSPKKLVIMINVTRIVWMCCGKISILLFLAHSSSPLAQRVKIDWKLSHSTRSRHDTVHWSPTISFSTRWKFNL